MISLRPYQEGISKTVFDYLIENPGKNPCIAAPPGSGKTVIIADIVKECLRQWEGTRIMVVSHVKEILQQDYDALVEHLDVPVGLFSKGLDSKTIEQVTVAGIQSVYRNTALFQNVDFVIVDEAHLISSKDTSMYQRFLQVIGKYRCVGLTATPFRLGSGYIYSGDGSTIFHDCVVDLTSMDNFNKLIDDGHLCELQTMPMEAELDTTGLPTVAGDYSNKAMSEKFDIKEITEAIIDEVMRKSEAYKKWLFFAIDITHAEHITEYLIQKGVNAYVVHSKMKDQQRDEIIQMYSTDKLKALVNIDILTTGFNVPAVDLIVTMRTTKSPVWHVQTMGRGLRPSKGKTHCMVFDFAGNTERLGPINDVHVHKKRKSKNTNNEPVTKRCPDCSMIHHPSVRKCSGCGHEFKFNNNIFLSSSGAPVIAKRRVNWYQVDDVDYTVHRKKYSPPSLKVTYTCGLRFFKEWVCIEHEGVAGIIARTWADRRLDRSYLAIPDITSEELLNLGDELKTPVSIQVDTSSKYPNILEYKFN